LEFAKERPTGQKNALAAYYSVPARAFFCPI